MEILLHLFGFLFIAFASYQIGRLFMRIGLPAITGYLLAGVVAGPFVLGLLPEAAVDELRFIDEVSLAVIAFIAGAELYLKEIRSRLKSIAGITTGVLIASTTISAVAIFLLEDHISFTQGLPLNNRIAVAILGGTVLLALSPASTIAVIKEVRARGVFTKTILGVTVTMDVVIIVLFAIAVAFASALLTDVGFEPSLLLLLAEDLITAVALGLITGKILQAILSTPWRFHVKAALILLIGYSGFAFSHWFIGFSHDNLPLEIHVEPLLVAVIAGFYVTNYTNGRDEFDQILHDVSPPIYIAFFTLTGLALNLEILLSILPIAVVLFLVRAGGLALGSYVGATIVGETKDIKQYAWMGFITQAGIVLGLAREVAVEFPSLGSAFATLIISVVVLNQILGPLFLKWALKQTGEAAVPDKEQAAPDTVRDVLILGIEPQSLELARNLQSHNWKVIMADTDRSHVERLAAEDVTEHYISNISPDTMTHLLTAETDAVVAMLNDDQANLQAIILACKKDVPRLIVRPNDLTMVETFADLGALVIDPTSAMVNLLEQSVRAPQSTAVLLHMDSGREMIQITIKNTDLDGMLLRDLRLPTDVLFMDITRDGNAMLPHGYTQLRIDDEVTLVGETNSLEEAVLKLGF